MSEALTKSLQTLRVRDRGAMIVRRAATTDVPALSRCLAAAFRTDPSHVWMFPDPHRRARRHMAFFAAYLRERLAYALVLTDDDLRGAAIWEEPRHAAPGLIEQLRLAVRMLPILGARFPLVALGTLRIMAAHPKEPHWYLSVLGTDPQYQGAGVGRSLMKPILDRCDAANLPAYLEASRAGNIPYYERHGFRTLGGITLPKGPTIWRMLRAPEAAGPGT